MTTLSAQTVHRAPPPSRPWSVAMRWHDLLFAHWPVSVDALRPLVPAALEIDTFDGSAWVSVIAFHMSGVRLRRMPYFCSLAFPELNVRTYVRSGDRRGIWFFSLDAYHRLGVRVARSWYGLPYQYARMSARREAGCIFYDSARQERGSPPAEFRAEYCPVSPACQAEPGTPEHWLVERYTLFSTDRHGRLFSGEVDHVPYTVQRADAEIRTNTMCTAAGITLPVQKPLLHYARDVDAVAWSVERVEDYFAPEGR